MRSDWPNGAAARKLFAGIRRALALRPGQSILIESWSHGVPLAEMLWLEARRAGVRPSLLLQPDGAFFASQRLSRTGNPNSISRVDLAALGGCDGYVYLPGPEDAVRSQLLPRANRRQLDQRSEEWNRELQRLRVPSVYLLAADATETAARSYGVELPAWRSEAVEASLVPASALRARSARLVRALTSRGRVSIAHPNGTEIELNLSGYRPIVQDGTLGPAELAVGWVWTVLPAGVVTVALDGLGASGRFRANRPSRHRRGTIEGLEWEFSGGRLSRYTARRGLALFERQFRQGGPERRRLAILSVGLNPKIRELPLAEDQEDGVVSLYLGHNEEFGGRTRGKFRSHALLRGATLLVDGRPFLRSGRWV